MAKAKTSTTKSKTKRPATETTKTVTAEAEPMVTRATIATKRGNKLLANALNGELVLGALVAELIGTFILTLALLNANANLIIAGITVMILVMVLSRVSGGHINPVVTISMWATRQISAIKAAGYVVAQVLGALLALVIAAQFIHTAPVDTMAGSAPQVLTIPDVVGQWRPFLAEALGGLVLGFGAAAAFLGRKKSMQIGFILGGSLLVGLLIAMYASSGIINPAVAAGLSAYHWENLWSVFTYAIGPIVGGVAGAWLYKLLQWDVTGEKELSE